MIGSRWAEGILLFYCEGEKTVLLGICPTVNSLEMVGVSWSQSFRSNNEFWSGTATSPNMHMHYIANGSYTDSL